MNELGEGPGGLRGAVSGRAYIRTRPRGFAPWSPKPASLLLVDQVRAILEEYRAHLPMTARQIFYRLVGAYAYPKDEAGYGRLIEMLNRARRARMIPMESMGGAGGYRDKDEFWSGVRSSARWYSRPPDEGQPRAVEVWVEAAGMMPMIARVTSEYGVAVYCSGGFESVGAKYDAAARLARRTVPTVVLSIGDQDPSGLALVDAAAEDVATFAGELGAEPPTVTRLDSRAGRRVRSADRTAEVDGPARGPHERDRPGRGPVPRPAHGDRARRPGVRRRPGRPGRRAPPVRARAQRTGRRDGPDPPGLALPPRASRTQNRRSAMSRRGAIASLHGSL
jgi:hypothetical protein